MFENIVQHIDIVNGILLVFFLLSFLVQAVYYLFIYPKAGYKQQKDKQPKASAPAVSVIICARNEEKNLQKNLPAVLTQDYPDYEVVVVNDCSDDNTAGLLEEFSKKYDHLKISTIRKDPKFSHGKKLALTIGIKASTKDHLLHIDADCIPAGKDWIKLMVRNFTEKKEIVLGVGLYEKQKGFLNLLIRFETAFTFMQYFSFAKIGKPYMGVGRNLAYAKDLFFRNKGFASHSNLRSGDDDLFVSETATRKNTALEKDPGSFTWSDPETNWKDYMRQRRRHLSTGSFYQQSVKMMLGAEYLSRVFLTLSFIILLARFPHFELVVPVYILLLIIKSLCFVNVFGSLHEKYLFLPSLLIEPLIPFFYGYIHLLNHLDRKSIRWN